MPSVLVILPTYNERENIMKLIPDIWKRISSSEDLNHILVVDDNSPDGTADAVAQLMQVIKNLHLIRRPRKMGLGSAYLDGFRWSLSHLKPEIYVQMDADLSHSPIHLTRLIQSSYDGFDIIIASRYVEGGGVADWPWYREIISRSANALVRLLLGLKVKDVTSGYRALNRRAVKELLGIKVRNEGYSYLLESLYLLSKKGFRVKEIPFTYQSRMSGKTKLSIRDTVRYALNLMRLTSSGRITA